MVKNKEFYKNENVIFLLLVFFPPLGILFALKYLKLDVFRKYVLCSASAILFVVVFTTTALTIGARKGNPIITLPVKPQHPENSLSSKVIDGDNTPGVNNTDSSHAGLPVSSVEDAIYSLGNQHYLPNYKCEGKDGQQLIGMLSRITVILNRTISKREILDIALKIDCESPVNVETQLTFVRRQDMENVARVYLRKGEIWEIVQGEGVVFITQEEWLEKD